MATYRLLEWGWVQAEHTGDQEKLEESKETVFGIILDIPWPQSKMPHVFQFGGHLDMFVDYYGMYRLLCQHP